MSSPARLLGCFLLVLPLAAQGADPIVVKESDVVFPGFLGMGRKVDSETLILPGASRVIRQQRARDRYVAMREARGTAEKEQQRQAEARRKAEAEAMADVAPAPADAASAEAAMAEASVESVSEEAIAGTSGSPSSETAAPAAEEAASEEPSPAAAETAVEEPVAAEPETAVAEEAAPAATAPATSE